MHTLPDLAHDADAATLWPTLAQSLTALLDGERDLVANAANTAALIWHGVPALNWAGFYLLQGDTLVLGPFQGKPACVRIPMGRGVCGTAAARRETVVVPDVHAFPGHIACDARSRAEVVVPVFDAAGGVLAVLDLDAVEPGAFNERDAARLEALAGRFLSPRA